MSKVVLLRIYGNTETVCLFSDGSLSIEELEAIIIWSKARICQIRSMQPKGREPSE